MTVRALDIIQSAFERSNRLSPGETLNADDAAFGFRRLNELADELAPQNLYLYRDIFTSAAVTGATITLGVGAWSAIAPGEAIVSAEASAYPMDPITPAQYGAIYDNTIAGIPRVYCPDGLSTVFLYPVPTNVIVKLHTRTGVQTFADQTTPYTLPQGWMAALSAALAVRMAPTLLGSVPDYLARAEAKCMGAVDVSAPKILDVRTYTRRRAEAGSILTGNY
jgi:hypothetical protein